MVPHRFRACRPATLLAVLALTLSPAAPAVAALEAELSGVLAPHDVRASLSLSPDAMPQAVSRFYQARDWHSLWDRPRLRSLLSELDGLRDDGLDPEDYFLSTLTALEKDASQSAALQRELLATQAYLLAGRDLFRGKVDPVQLDSHWNFKSRSIDPLAGLELARDAAEANQLADFFQRARPTLPQYAIVRRALARYRQQLATVGEWPRLPAGASLRPGDQDARVPVLRERLRLAGLLPDGGNADSPVYDAVLQEAVMRFQKESYLTADGIVGLATVNALNVPLSARIGQLRANLERLRWFDRQKLPRAVIVDLAGYRIQYVENEVVRWRSRVQIGRSVRPTPILQSRITHLTLNPTWTVPPTIFREDSLPAIRRDRGYLTRNTMQVLDARGKVIPAASVNWAAPGNIFLRQAAGPRNSLGELVIRFPNDDSIYLHDTPHKSHFSDSQRAFSSGCIRVENIHELAVLLLNGKTAWTREQLDAALQDRRTRNQSLDQQIPILIAYWTVDIGNDGHVSFKPDVYDQDARILAALDTRRTLPVLNARESSLP